MGLELNIDFIKRLDSVLAEQGLLIGGVRKLDFSTFRCEIIIIPIISLIPE